MVEAIAEMRSGIERQDLIASFYTLANNSFDRYKNGSRLLEQEDAVQEAVTDCWLGIELFDPSKGTSYNYFRQVVAHAFGKLVKHATRQKRYPGETVSLSWDAEGLDPEGDGRIEYLKSKSANRAARKKLFPHEVQKIRKAIKAGMSGADIAKKFGVDPSTVCKIRHGKSYRKVK